MRIIPLKFRVFISRILLVFFVCATVLSPLSASADEAIVKKEDARIDRVFVRAEPAFQLSFVVRDAFKEEIEEAIKSGIPTKFTFFIELYQVHRFWLDNSVSKWEYRHVVKYDSLKEEYEITLDEKPGEIIRTKDYEEMKRLMTSGEDITFTPTPILKRGAKYELRVMAELDTIRLPFLLNYMLFFVKFWDFETDWYTARFSY
ncbi:MAG: DUF4390 domain-containing protein [Thermodesulfobacteriota bacterium]